MKKIILCLAILSISFCLVAQNQDKGDKDKLKGLKILKSEKIDKVEVEIQKPDPGATLPVKNKDFDVYPKLEIKSRILKSNKILY